MIAAMKITVNKFIVRQPNPAICGAGQESSR